MATSSAFTHHFKEDKFRYAILNTFLMGMPESDDDKLKWYWRRDKTYSPDDPAGNPYDWSSGPIVDDPGNPGIIDTPGEDQYLIVPYALEFSSRPAGSVPTILGEIDNSRAVITLLDSDYDQIKTADYCTISSTIYRIQFDSTPFGLFGVTVWQVFLEAEDEH